MKALLNIKCRLILLALLATSASVFAQDEPSKQDKSSEATYQTIFNPEKVRISGFGGPFMNFTTVDEKYGNFLGLGGGLTLNEFFFGLFGMGMTNRIRAHEEVEGEFLQLDHGGFWTGYSFAAHSAIHPAFHIKTGWGLLRTVNDQDKDQVSDNYFVLSPALELEFNFAPFLKAVMGMNYNLYYGIELSGYDNNALNALGGHIAFKFGDFD